MFEHLLVTVITDLRVLTEIVCVVDRGFAVGIYTTNSAEACQYVAENCQANILVVENNKQLQKILQVTNSTNTHVLMTFNKPE